MERYTDNPHSRATSRDDFEEQSLSRDSSSSTKRRHSRSISIVSAASSPEERESFIGKKDASNGHNGEYVGFRQPETLMDQIRQSCFNALSTARRRRIIVGICVSLFIFICALTVLLLAVLKKDPPLLTSPVGNSERDEYCTSWPVTKIADEHFEFSQASHLNDLWKVDADPRPYTPKTITDGYGKPGGIKIVAIVFYGRREYVDVLDCYLERNLAHNGGFLDEVRFLARTSDPKDLDYLEQLVGIHGSYSRVEVSERCRGVYGVYDCMWEDLTERDTMYIKIDDDVVWIDDDAIPNLVHMRITNTEAYAVGSNLVNSHLMSWAQWHTGAIYPYLPEADPLPRASRVSWRPSELPDYNGTILAVDTPDYPLRDVFSEPPFEGHRWLPIRNDSSEILHTPMYGVEHEDLGIVVEQWSLGAQMHMSLLQNIEEGTLHKYHVGNGDGIWHPQYRRYNLNFAAIWSSDIAKALPFDGDDEEYVTVTAPRRFKQPFLVADRSLVAHYHFGPQTEKMRWTDILDRYRAYANEFVCPARRKRMPLSEPCPGFDRAD